MLVIFRDSYVVYDFLLGVVFDGVIGFVVVEDLIEFGCCSYCNW